MASSITSIGCGICLEEYNGTTRRPKTLPCGHNFCGPCLHNCIAQGENRCSICRRSYTVGTDDISTNIDLEKIIQMWSLMAGNIARTESGDEEDDFSNGLCSSHRKSLLYFKCKTHDIDICRKCIVVEHSPLTCNIIEIKDDVINTKEDTLKKAEQNSNRLTSTTAALETIVIQKNENISSKKAQIQCIMKEIEEDCKVRDQAKKDVGENKNILRQLNGSIEKLQEATTKENINKESSELQDKLRTFEELIGELEKKHDTLDFSKLLLKYPKHATKVMQERSISVYAVDGEDIVRSSKILPVDGRLQISSLEKDVRPTPNAIVIPMSSVLSAAGDQPVVYLDLEGNGRPIGRVRIRLTCGPRRRKQMLCLCTAAQGGHTWKGIVFDYAEVFGQESELIMCNGYINPDGTTSSSNIVHDLEGDQCKVFVAGAVTGDKDDTSFKICHRTDPSDTTMNPELGHVLSGLDLLTQALTRHYITNMAWGQYDGSWIRIIDSGVEIADDI